MADVDIYLIVGLVVALVVTVVYVVAMVRIKNETEKEG